MVFALMGAMIWGALKFDFFSRQAPEVYTDERGVEWDIYHDDLPLRSEDFVAVDEAAVYSYRAEAQSSLLLAVDTYTQRSYHFNKDLYAPETGYDVLQVKADFMYDYCLEQWTQKDIGRDLVWFDRAYVDDDPAPWGADDAYRLYDTQSSELLDSWILCKGDYIIRIHTDWDMTDEMKPLVLEKLGLTD